MIVLLVLGVSLLLVVGQILLKLGIGVTENLNTTSSIEFVWRLIWTPYFLASAVAIGSSGLLWIYIVRSYELSLAYPLTSMSYILMLIGSYYVFDERITLTKILGVLIIVVGIVVLTLSGRVNELPS